MDLMEIRRAMMGVIAGMAWNNIIKGTFSQNTTGAATIDFGKTITGSYIVYFEMTDESKSSFKTEVQSINLNRTYGFLAIKWSGNDTFDPLPMNYVARYNGSTLNANNNANSPVTEFGTDHIRISVADISGNANTAYPNYTYNYMIVPID